MQMMTMMACRFQNSLRLRSIANQAGQTATADDTADDDGKKKAGKASAKKSKGGREDASQTIQRNRAFGKFFHMLTEDLVPRTDRGKSFAAEKEAKAAKEAGGEGKKGRGKTRQRRKQKAKDEEKRGCQEGKAGSSSTEKKEKQAEKEKKAAAKQAKLEAEGTKSAFRLRRWQLALCLVPRWAALLS